MSKRLDAAKKYAAIFQQDCIDDAEEFLNDLPEMAEADVMMIKWLETLTDLNTPLVALDGCKSRVRSWLNMEDT